MLLLPIPIVTAMVRGRCNRNPCRYEHLGVVRGETGHAGSECRRGGNASSSSNNNGNYNNSRPKKNNAKPAKSS